jgi:putative N6-adenine-specific DNA methylase
MKFVAKTLYGLEHVLADELAGLGATDIVKVNRAVTFKGDLSLLYRTNYCCRTALSVLVNIAEFRIKSKDDLYRDASSILWSSFIGPDDTFSVVPVVHSGYFTHTGYPGLVLKDAIADYFRKTAGRRPTVDTVNPRIIINLHISNDKVSVSLDSSMVPLFKRGYRQGVSAAPLNEVLAAGILLISGWKRTVPLLDPMCGSGTIPIEAGMIACNIPPGRSRKFFGFQNWKDYDPVLFDSIKREADEKITMAGTGITGRDISPEAIKQASTNAEIAGLKDLIRFETEDFSKNMQHEDGCWLFLNPPYGERLQPGETADLYSSIGNSLKHNFHGSVAWIITSNKESLKHIALKPSAKFTLFNGALECLLLKYEMYPGTRRKSQS